jgi:hypothetical protein
MPSNVVRSALRGKTGNQRENVKAESTVYSNFRVAVMGELMNTNGFFPKKKPACRVSPTAR